MPEGTPSAADPFAEHDGPIAQLADRIGVTEGQLYSMVIGVLLAWAVSANALPSVIWNRVAATAPIAAAGAPPPQSGAPLELPQAEPLAPPPALPLLPDEAAPLLVDFAAPAPAPADDAGPGFPAAPPQQSVTPSEQEERGLLRITQAGYASAGSGTPLATLGVPDGSVAVTRRGGSDYNVTYLRLAGEGPLDLAVDADGTNTPADLAGLRLCVVKPAQWKVGRGDVSLADAPAVDCTKAVPGVFEPGSGQWSFDIVPLGLPDGAGVAVLPDEATASPEFQVVFKIGPLETASPGGPTS